MKKSNPSGRFLIRAPRNLHAALKKRAKAEGVSLNELVACVLAAGVAARKAQRESEACAIWHR